MIDPLVLLAFLPAGLALNLTPGADMLFCLAQGTRGGARPAIAASAGISTGSMVHVTLAGLGLGWLAWRTLGSPLNQPGGDPVRPARAFRDGLVVNLTNPKVILFILAFVPQFVDPSRAVLPQFLIFGAMIAGFGFFINAAVGVLAGGIGQQMARNPRIEKTLRWITATIFGALALRLILEGKRA